MKKILILPLVLFFLVQGSMAQTPKWVEKAKRAVFSVVTYDKNDKMLNTGNGFFVSEDGLALSDYSLFKGAERAVVITADGKQMPVDVILGANDMYDVIKFRVAITEKKVPALNVAKAAPEVGADAWMLPYSTQKSIACVSGKVKDVSKVAGEYHYYTLGMQMKDKMVSCPVMNAEGQVFGISQKSSGIDTVTTCYAAGAAFAMAQKINALSLGDAALKSIGIRKGLPEVEDQALVYLFMASSQMTDEEYGKLLDDFIRQFPNSTDGYIRRANYYVTKGQEDQSWFDKAVADFNKALKVAQKKDDVYYNIAKLMHAYQLSKPEKTYKDWTYDTALKNLRQAIAIDPLPVYTQLEGDILFAQQDYAGALTAYEKVNASNIASPATFFSAAKTKELLKADPKEVIVLMDSCIARCPQPVTSAFAPYLLERAQMNLNANQARNAMLDYDAYFKAVNGQVNDMFYYYREQAALKARQYQRALDDIAKAIELNPKDLTYKAEQAVVNLRVGRYEEAVQILNNILKEDPKYAEAYRLLGLCQIQLKKTDEACGNFNKAKELGVVEGVWVSEIVENGSASGADIKVDDVIIGLDNKKVSNMADLQEAIAKHRPGDKVKVKLIRDKKEKTVEVTLKNEQGTTKIVKDAGMEILGAAFKELPDDLKKQLNLGYGLQVTGVSSGKMSDAGVRKGFIILKANDQPMRKVSDLEEVMKAAVKSPNQVLFLTGVFPSGKRGYFAVDLTQE